MKKNLAKVVTLGLLTASVFVVNGFGQAWAEDKTNSGLAGTGVMDRVDVTVTTNKPENSKLTDVTIKHTGASNHGPENTKFCNESSQSITIGQIATMNEAYMANDKALQSQIDTINTNISNIGNVVDTDIHLEGGTLNGNKLELQVENKDGSTYKKISIDGIASTDDLTNEITRAQEVESGLRKDVGDLRKDTGVLRDDVNTLRKDTDTLRTDLGNEINNRDAADKKLQNAIDTNSKDIGDLRKDTGVLRDDVNTLRKDTDTLRTDLGNEIKDRKAADEAHEEYMGKKDDKGDVTLIDKGENLSKNVGDLDRAISDETTRATGEEQRIENKFNGEVSRLDSRIDKLDGRVEKVGAMAAAMASLHTMGYDPAAPTEIAVGVGQYRDKTGFALGAFHYPNKNFMLNVSVSTAGDEFMAGIGATWKIGRRSPEAMLKAEQEKAARQALAKAEAEKQAAKDARVAAQAARHAKMLAERGL